MGYTVASNARVPFVGASATACRVVPWPAHDARAWRSRRGGACRHEQRHDAVLARQLQTSLHECHGQIGVVLVAPTRCWPKPVVALGEALAKRSRQCLAPYPWRIADDEVESTGRHDVGEVHGVVESGKAAVTLEPTLRRAQVAPVCAQLRKEVAVTLAQPTALAKQRLPWHRAPGRAVDARLTRCDRERGSLRSVLRAAQVPESGCACRIPRP